MKIKQNKNVLSAIILAGLVLDIYNKIVYLVLMQILGHFNLINVFANKVIMMPILKFVYNVNIHAKVIIHL